MGGGGVRFLYVPSADVQLIPVEQPVHHPHDGQVEVRVQQGPLNQLPVLQLLLLLLSLGSVVKPKENHTFIVPRVGPSVSYRRGKESWIQVPPC